MIGLRHQNSHDEPGATTELLAHVDELSQPLREEADLGPLLDRIGDARIVLLGAATHGTVQFHDWRARITRRLVAEKGFSFVATDGEWAEFHPVNRFAKAMPGTAGNPTEAFAAFRSWPGWLWANREFAALTEWLHEQNISKADDRKVGIYGLDGYALWSSLHSIIGYLDQIQPTAALDARRGLHCFEPYGEDVEPYTRATRIVPSEFTSDVLALLEHRRRTVATPMDEGRAGDLGRAMTDELLAGARDYYGAFIRGDADAWNLRERHMLKTLEMLLESHGPQAKAVVWTHNAHAGDARYSSMMDDGLVSVGQLARERYPEKDVVLVGCTAYEGSVAAARLWDAPPEAMRLPHARYGSWEALLHQASARDKLVVFPPRPTLDESLLQPRGHRAVGVVYHPEIEHIGNYVASMVPGRYDALLYFDIATALQPLLSSPLHERPASDPESQEGAFKGTEDSET